MFNYDSYNREERALCAHLFRLLHERLDERENSALGKFLHVLLQKDIFFKNRKVEFGNLSFNNVGIFCEAALIRDAYVDAKPMVEPFMDILSVLLMEQENVHDCRVFSDLPEELKNPKLTHPKQIKLKAITKQLGLTEEELKVYGAMQAMFNAKPDLVITIDNKLLVFEAKFTERFDPAQLERTWRIAEVWAHILYMDLGFSEQPEYSVIKLGLNRYQPDISWEEIACIAKEIYPEKDRARVAIEAALGS